MGTDRMPHPRRHALLVGVDLYPRLPACSQLRGSAADARLMSEVLAVRFGFGEKDMTLLLDKAATRSRILAALRALRARARSGDTVVFYYSGHGSRVPDLDGDEPSGWDVTIVPHDGGRPPHPLRDISHHEIHAWLLDVSEVTRNSVVVIADTCFSAILTREDDGPAPGERWIEPDPRPASELPPSPFALRPTRSAMRSVGPSGFLPLDERYVLLAACRHDERAKEMSARNQGVFTFYLCQDLLRASAETTYREVIEWVRPAVAAEVADRTPQTPQAAGARDRVLFEDAGSPPGVFLPVLAREDGRVQLGGGAVHGVVKGSQWAVYPAGTRSAAGADRLGLVRIGTVRGTRSDAKIVEAMGAPIESGARAFENAPGLDGRARAEQLLAIECSAANCRALRHHLAVELLRSRSADEFEIAGREPGGAIVFHPEDRLALRITHDAGQPLYVHVLNIALDGAIRILYPVSGASDPLVPGVTLEIGTRPGQGLIVRLPKELAAQARATGQQRFEGREVLKVFATTLESDLTLWRQPERGVGAMGAMGAMGAKDATGAKGAVAFRDDPAAAADDRWTVRTLSFLVRAELLPASPRR